jgi:hypothetical protein
MLLGPSLHRLDENRESPTMTQLEDKQPKDRGIWDLLFTVEVAAVYHDWRRGALGTWVVIVRAAALLGAIISLIAINALDEHVVFVISVVSAITGAIVLTDLVFGTDQRARDHDALFRRCKELQARILDGRTPLPELKAEAQRIWGDEPPILWAIYAKCWNQIVARHESEARYKKRVGFWASTFGSFMQFSPQDFESAQPTSS